MKRNYLLPHICQRAGLWLGVAAFVAIVICKVLSAKGVIVNTATALSAAGGYIYTLLAMLMCVAVLLITFSKERCEDEMIDAVRKSSVTSVAYTVFLIFTVVSILWYMGDLCFNLRHADSVWHQTESNRLRELMNFIKDPFVIFVFYQAVFRIRLSKLKKALKDEE